MRLASWIHPARPLLLGLATAAGVVFSVFLIPRFIRIHHSVCICNILSLCTRMRNHTLFLAARRNIFTTKKGTDQSWYIHVDPSCSISIRISRDRQSRECRSINIVVASSLCTVLWIFRLITITSCSICARAWTVMSPPHVIGASFSCITFFFWMSQRMSVYLNKLHRKNKRGVWLPLQGAISPLFHTEDEDDILDIRKALKLDFKCFGIKSFGKSDNIGQVKNCERGDLNSRIVSY